MTHLRELVVDVLGALDHLYFPGAFRHYFCKRRCVGGAVIVLGDGGTAIVPPCSGA